MRSPPCLCTHLLTPPHESFCSHWEGGIKSDFISISGIPPLFHPGLCQPTRTPRLACLAPVQAPEYKKPLLPYRDRMWREQRPAPRWPLSRPELSPTAGETGWRATARPGLVRQAEAEQPKQQKQQHRGWEVGWAGYLLSNCIHRHPGVRPPHRQGPCQLPWTPTASRPVLICKRQDQTWIPGIS